MKQYTNDKGVTFSSYASDMNEELINQTYDIAGRFSDAKVVLMPDAHVGNPAPIGLTIKFNDIKPSERYDVVELVGNDIGCGVSSVGIQLSRTLTTEELETIYQYIEKNVPIFRDETTVSECKTYGTLGSGNHFIELGNIDNQGKYLLTVHSGSRAEGARVYNKYKKSSSNYQSEKLKKELIDVLKRSHLEGKIQELVTSSEFKSTTECMSEDEWEDYLLEMRKAVTWAGGSRHTMITKCLDGIDEVLNCKVFLEVNNMHNFLEIDSYSKRRGTLRKGAIPQKGDKFLLTPLSMKEGVLVSLPIPSEENNDSAMHGAGRSLSRKLARETISMSKFKDDMDGIVAHPREEILDEAPDAYKTLDTIVNDSSTMCMPLFIAKPVLNFKGSDNAYTKYMKGKDKE